VRAMTLIGTWCARIGALLFLLTGQGAAQRPSDLAAILTQADGLVTLSPTAREGFLSARRAAQRQTRSRSTGRSAPRSGWRQASSVAAAARVPGGNRIRAVALTRLRDDLSPL